MQSQDRALHCSASRGKNITYFSCTTAVRRPLYSRPRKNRTNLIMLIKLQFVGHILLAMFIESRTVSSESHNIRVAYLRQACRPEIALEVESCIQGHSRSSLLVSADIQNGVLS